MSLEDFLAQDTMTISRPDPTKDTSGGMVRLPADVVFTDVPVRVETRTSSQRNEFGQREIITDQVLFTQQRGIRNGDIATLSDGTILRLTLSFDSNREMGSIDTYFEIVGQQVGQLQEDPQPQLELVSGGSLQLVSGGSLLLAG